MNIPDRVGMGERQETPAATPGARPASPAARERLEQAMGREGSRPATDKGRGKGEAESDKSSHDPSGTASEKGAPYSGGMAALLGNAGRALLAGGTEPLAASATQPVAAAVPVNLGEIVDQILVAQPGPDGGQEVSLKINQPWLPATEINLLRKAGGELAVEFRSDHPDAQRFLLPNLAELRGRLESRLESPVVVRLAEHAGSNSGGADSEGRSRNRYTLIEELGDN